MRKLGGVQGIMEIYQRDTNAVLNSQICGNLNVINDSDSNGL